MAILRALSAALPLLPLLLPAAALAAPTVTIAHPQATIVGYAASGVDNFLALPFAQPPVGDLRLRKPRALNASLGTFTATTPAQECPQFQQQTSGMVAAARADGSSFADSAFARDAAKPAEDCLTLNVQRPSTAHAGSKLPVVFWIYGGGFEFGSIAGYNATNLITTSINNGHPVIYVAVNYRLGGFGFLPGKEVMAAGISNLGLLDQRLGLKWVADNIEAFGGDPSKVTLWGESAGSISVWSQLGLYGGKYSYKGKPLFRAAVMDSGSIIPSLTVGSSKGVAVFDKVLSSSGCAPAATNGTGVLNCLRALPYATYLNAANSVPALGGYNSVAVSYQPRPDGVVLPDSPEILALDGRYARVPFIIGDQEDEGTIFATQQSNLTTTDDVVDYLYTIFFPSFPRARVAAFVATYPDNATAGSPFRTGTAGERYPQYKRLAAILGDISFTLLRRSFLSIARDVSPKVRSWSYLATYLHDLDPRGTYHSSDLGVAYGAATTFPSRSTQAYYLSFFNTMDPNAQVPAGTLEWPEWGSKPNGTLLVLGNVTNSLRPDTFRSRSYHFLTDRPRHGFRI